MFPKTVLDLPLYNRERSHPIPFLKGFTDADNGDESCLEAALIFRFTVSSVSPKYWRLSE